MTAQPHEPASPAPQPPSSPDRSLRAIREALLPEEIGDFDREFRAVMAEATETLDLAPLQSFVERWWRVAWLSGDPERHRNMLRQADEILAGRSVPTTPWSTTKAELGL